MKERPILFSAPMVRAILAGTKTQTRRIVKPLPLMVNRQTNSMELDVEAMNDGRLLQRCPYGQPGDRLYVKETWRIDDFDDAETIYAADGDEEMMRETKGIIKWRSPIYMPRNRSRITLEITGVKVERLNDISEQDAIAEGAEPYRLPCHPQREALRHVDGFHTLWESINGPGSWERNPFVWAIEFRRVEK